MASHNDSFTCPSCGKSYRWRGEIAGRAVKCQCGAKFEVPTRNEDEDGFELEPLPPPLPRAMPATPRHTAPSSRGSGTRRAQWDNLSPRDRLRWYVISPLFAVMVIIAGAALMGATYLDEDIRWKGAIGLFAGIAFLIFLITRYVYEFNHKERDDDASD